MGIKHEKFEYYRGSLKNPIFRGGHKKPIYRGDCLKRWAWTVCRFKGRAWRKREGGVFEGGGRGGGRYPNAHTL